MEDLNCFVIDDESHSIEILRLYIEQTPGLRLIKTFNNPYDAIEEVKIHLPDITFLDIEMPQLSGIDVHRLISDYTTIIFISGFKEHAVNAFNLQAHDFLLKPFSFERFQQSVHRIKRIDASTQEHIDSFFIKTDKGKFVKILKNEILYIEGALNYVKIHTTKSDQLTYLTMGEMEKLLPRLNFLRIHKSFLINTDKIIEIDGNTVILEDRSRVQLGTTYKETFFKLIEDSTVKSKRKI
ncbi:LytTR family DNA-binding domain-containing protein [Pedobacter sp. L105]|uniref:LytR/AlgR family response regulator transcription factor n=1 Tax=Pedobacter sp. L105 TaxID=1641871 RepID=UPI00131EC1B2|nr:LytTR family DNA-binding domain-containing protein [Pedobacter sp. L105]